MLFKKAVNKKLTEAAEVMTEPAKKAIQDKINTVKQVVGNRSDLGAKLFKFLLGGALVIFTFREEKQQNPQNYPRLQQPTPNIVINNYIKEDRNDRKYQRNPKSGSEQYRQHN
jgi:hypothetical protein